MTVDHSRRHTIVAVAVTILFALILFVGTVQIRQITHYRRAVAAEERGDRLAALSGYESAIRFHTPFSPLVDRSAARLWEMAERARTSGDPEFALIVYRDLRSSFYAARSLYVPGMDWIRRCDTRIVELEQQGVGSRTPAGGAR